MNSVAYNLIFMYFVTSERKDTRSPLSDGRVGKNFRRERIAGDPSDQIGCDHSDSGIEEEMDSLMFHKIELQNATDNQSDQRPGSVRALTEHSEEENTS